MAKAKAEAEWPDGNEEEIGMRTCRASGTSVRSGRLRRLSSLTPRFTPPGARAMAASPRTAAPRPCRPPVTASPAAQVSHSFEWSAKRDSVASSPSSDGVGVRAIAS